MKGVRRSGITVAAGQFQKAGLIHYDRGHIEIIDRPGLESVSYDCYGIVRRAQDPLLGLPKGAAGIYRS